MNRKLAIEWLKASYSDLVLIAEIIDNDFLTHMIAFHSQQSIEKAFKAIMGYHNQPIPKKHDLLLLKNKIQNYISVNDEGMLDQINEIYIDSRYPAELGLLPNGKPGLTKAKDFYEFAQSIFDAVCVILGIDKNELKQ